MNEHSNTFCLSGVTPLVANRGRVAKMVMNLLDHWHLTVDEQASLLGLSANSRSTLMRYRKGIPIGRNRDQLDRVSHLLGLHKNLRLLFPQNRDLAYEWMKARNRAFDNLTPVEVIAKYGFRGMLTVRTYLDRKRNN